ncbi:SDR family NAD(P)-dependent oxidoreductase [Mycobacteroides abscessus]|uniref:SDR family NAD(P)-dependent oxidoreductase n=1 Tax=Mycobacteroides abscessus TaxID=36809 RepID=UPI0009275742|nr:SDR family NAD(P)-dependent oxidoreductase [Mycobacteroides abscessus]MBN7548418.1 SDR family NAD(P)-dependent oxidoreductase [Mycobacteroides abscessus subsp. abscessus]MDM2692259.1 SDR family NAD(P)-dependent oxidoreductase [Mycobacteroides abscessus]MDM2697071.1 SDR family NAD(P)-dependent oxidoreductase [Mycobacteroides abscessus]MDM2702205.1 SDR family NAD(P)-dependent oxidoreductase [Mycobacteroides abscessus]MDO3265670.1 SDR family NAD(P)-dependent oxidoreductase [Mycobacteroides abs
MKTAVVTGAGRGIGLAITQRLAGSGWHVLAGARSPQALDTLRAIDGVTPVLLDITNGDHIAALADAVGDKLDGLVNNAGQVVYGPIESLRITDFAALLDVNTVSQINVTQQLMPALRSGGGRVIFISSLSGRVATPWSGAYCASKFALEAAADALRVELRQWSVPVSIIEPGTTDTDIWRGSTDDFDSALEGMTDDCRKLYADQAARVRRALPLIRKLAVSPERIARVVETALTSRRPRARYLCDMASRTEVALSAMTPSRIVDAVLGNAITPR